MCGSCGQVEREITTCGQVAREITTRWKHVLCGYFPAIFMEDSVEGKTWSCDTKQTETEPGTLDFLRPPKNTLCGPKNPETKGNAHYGNPSYGPILSYTIFYEKYNNHVAQSHKILRIF